MVFIRMLLLRGGDDGGTEFHRATAEKGCLLDSDVAGEVNWFGLFLAASPFLAGRALRLRHPNSILPTPRFPEPCHF